jgi:hypothetical protein
METIDGKNGSFLRLTVALARAFVLAGFLLAAVATRAQPGPGGGIGVCTNVPLDSWSFYDPTNWTSDFGYAPLSFTNLAYSILGDFQSLVVDTNVPAWLQYNVYESDGTTNLTVDNGTLTLWFAADWSSTDQGGSGPGEYGRLFEAGAYTTNSSYGWWSIYVDPAGTNVYFSAQTNDLSGTVTTYIAAPISWTNDYFHFLALTYSATNTALYLDGVLVTNGPGVTVYPGPEVLTNGFYIGSDNSGVDQAHGLFDTVAAYNYPMSSDDVQLNFHGEYMYIGINPNNQVMFALTPASSAPAYEPAFDVITGPGDLGLVSSGSGCPSGTNVYDVWITNFTAKAVSNEAMTVTFTIAGGSNQVPYDVFANSVLSFGTNGVPWAWMGQGYRCNTYLLTILSNSTCYLILGTPLDTSGLGLTDAYERLVAKVNPSGGQTDSYGVPYAWYAQNGLVPITAGLATQDADQDGLLNWEEYMWGSKPTVPEGFSIWVSTPNGTTSIP